MSNIEGIPTIRSGRIILRPFRLSDAKAVQRMAGSAKVAATTATIPHPYPHGAAEKWISQHEDLFKKGDGVNWAIENADDGSLIGCVSFGINTAHRRAEIGYWVGEEFWNMGFCTEAAQLAVDFAFDVLNLNKITSRHMADNPGSGKVMQKIGMTKEGYLAKDFYKTDRFVDMVVYGLLKDNRGAL